MLYLEDEDSRISEDEAKASSASGRICYKLLCMFLLFLSLVIFDTCVLTKQPTNKYELHEINFIYLLRIFIDCQHFKVTQTQ